MWVRPPLVSLPVEPREGFRVMRLRRRAGEESPQWASADPFAAPVWRPPIWRLPEGLVMVGQLVKALARLVVFVVRHPVFATVAAGLGWVGWRFGWQVLAWAAGVAALVLNGWFGLHRPSFTRLVGLPALARWRWLWTYRRHWQPVLLIAGLARAAYGREYVPSLRRVACTAWLDRVLVKMLPGQAPTDWERRADQVAHGFAAPSCRVRTARPGWIWLEFPRRDPLAGRVDAPPIPDRVDLARLPVGRCEDGSPWLLRLAGTHVLVAGVTGSGKGSVLWSAVRAMLPAVAAGLVEVWVCDPKRMELSLGRRLFRRYADDPPAMVALLERAVATMADRAGVFAGRTRTHTPTAAHPFVVVVVDELAFLTADLPDRDLRRRAEQALATLTSQGRSVGVCVLGALQDPRKEVMNLRNLFPDRIALRLDEAAQVDMVLGEGARDRGAYADQISHGLPGVGYMRRETTPDPVRVRAGYVSDTDIAAMLTDYPPSVPHEADEYANQRANDDDDASTAGS